MIRVDSGDLTTHLLLQYSGLAFGCGGFPQLRELPLLSDKVDKGGPFPPPMGRWPGHPWHPQGKLLAK